MARSETSHRIWIFAQWYAEQTIKNMRFSLVKMVVAAPNKRSCFFCCSDFLSKLHCIKKPAYHAVFYVILNHVGLRLQTKNRWMFDCSVTKAAINGKNQWFCNWMAQRAKIISSTISNVFKSTEKLMLAIWRPFALQNNQTSINYVWHET